MTKKNIAKSLNVQGKQVFIENINMETQTIYKMDGRVITRPCDFELGQHILAGGRSNISQRGSMRIDDDGNGTFRPFRTDTGTPYDEIFDTPHGSVREYKTCIVVKHKFPKKLGKTLIEALYNEESNDVKAFIKTRRTETEWG